jgi:hypothetical protein
MSFSGKAPQQQVRFSQPHRGLRGKKQIGSICRIAARNGAPTLTYEAKSFSLKSKVVAVGIHAAKPISGHVK